MPLLCLYFIPYLKAPKHLIPASSTWPRGPLVRLSKRVQLATKKANKCRSDCPYMMLLSFQNLETNCWQLLSFMLSNVQDSVKMSAVIQRDSLKVWCMQDEKYIEQNSEESTMKTPTTQLLLNSYISQVNMVKEDPT